MYFSAAGFTRCFEITETSERFMQITGKRERRMLFSTMKDAAVYISKVVAAESSEPVRLVVPSSFTILVVHHPSFVVKKITSLGDII